MRRHDDPCQPERTSRAVTTGINDRGQILGAYERPDRVVRPFVRDRQGRFTERSGWRQGSSARSARCCFRFSRKAVLREASVGEPRVGTRVVGDSSTRTRARRRTRRGVSLRAAFVQRDAVRPPRPWHGHMLMPDERATQLSHPRCDPEMPAEEVDLVGHDSFVLSAIVDVEVIDAGMDPQLTARSLIRGLDGGAGPGDLVGLGDADEPRAMQRFGVAGRTVGLAEQPSRGSAVAPPRVIADCHDVAPSGLGAGRIDERGLIGLPDGGEVFIGLRSRTHLRRPPPARAGRSGGGDRGTGPG